jgi:DNA-binding SARP family transcriptional activator
MTEAGGLRVGLLGPLLLSRDGVQLPVPAGLGVVLAALALSVNRVVSADTLVATIWTDDASRDRERNLHARVYQVRKLLPAAVPAGQPTRLVTQAPGYRLNLAAAELDVTMFDTLAADGRAAARASDSRRAAEQFGAALELWRGVALADVSGLSARLAAAAAALEERRLGVVEARSRLSLTAGGTAS